MYAKEPQNFNADAKKKKKLEGQEGCNFNLFGPGCPLAPFWSRGGFETSFGAQNNETMDP